MSVHVVNNLSNKRPPRKTVQASLFSPTSETVQATQEVSAGITGMYHHAYFTSSVSGHTKHATVSSLYFISGNFVTKRLMNAELIN